MTTISSAPIRSAQLPTTGPQVSGMSPTAAIRRALTEADEMIVTGVHWLLRHLDSGVPTCDPAGTYRLPLTLALTGHRRQAAHVLGWLCDEILTDDGDLAPGPMRSAFSQRWASYPLAIIAQAAGKLDRYDLVTRIIRQLRNFQDPVTGGALAARPECRNVLRQDLFPTAQLGITALELGAPDLADGAARWLARLWQQQPQLPDVLYTGTVGADLIVDPGSDPMERFGLVTDLRAHQQAFYNPSIAAAFLARYSAARTDAAAGELAARYLNLASALSPQQTDVWESVQHCKFGWGAAALLDLTGSTEYLEQVVGMVDWFGAAQQPDGHWTNSPFLLPDGDTLTASFEVTAEFVQHLVVMVTSLAGSAARR